MASREFRLGVMGGAGAAAAALGLWALARAWRERQWQHKGSELVGVLGGLGPAASALFMQLLVETGERAGAKVDADHPPVLLYVNPELPNSRAAAIGEGPSPQVGMAASFRRLRAAGATRVCVVCNTAHAFSRAAARDAGAPFLDMLELTARKVVQRFAAAGKPADTVFRVGLMSTDGTIKMGLYQSALEAAAAALLGSATRLDVLVPKDLSVTQNCITRIKGNDYRGNDVAPTLKREATALVDRGAEVIITGCTELPVAFNEELHPAFPVPIVNPMQILADEIVRLTLASQAQG